MVKDKARLCLVGVITWIIIPGLGSVVSAHPPFTSHKVRPCMEAVPEQLGFGNLGSPWANEALTVRFVPGFDPPILQGFRQVIRKSTNQVTIQIAKGFHGQLQHLG